MLSRTKFEISELINEILDELPKEVFISNCTTFGDLQIGGGQFIFEVVNRLRKFGHSDDNIRTRVFGFAENKLYYSYVMGKYPTLPVNFDIYNEEINMKFDVILGNPPYQIKVGPKKTEPIWDKFAIKCFSLLKEDGYISLIHPSGWRNVEGRFKKTQKLFLKNKVIYLRINNEKKGIEIFGSETRFDYYLIQKTPKNNFQTKVIFQDDSVGELVLDEMEFIPNGGMNLLNKLLAKNEEETVKVLYSRSGYGTDKKHTSKTQNEDYTHPLIYTVNFQSQPSFYYSSNNKNGHFGIPKVIWSNGRISSVGSIIDSEGQYGLTQFAYAIVDEPEILPKIKKVLDSKKFKEFMELCAVGQLTINHKIISKFKKDFWKEFINE